MGVPNIDRLQALGASILVPQDRLELRSKALDAKTVAEADLVLIVTDHDAVDYGMLGEHAKLIVDTRNAMARVPSFKARLVKS